MTKAKIVNSLIVVACALVVIAHAPAILLSPIETAVAQVRWNAYNKERAEAAALVSSETMTQDTATSAKKAK